MNVLRKAIPNGPLVYPSASFIELPEGSEKYLRYGDRNEIAEEMVPSIIIEHHLIGGDIVLFNRQRSLH